MKRVLADVYMELVTECPYCNATNTNDTITNGDQELTDSESEQVCDECDKTYMLEW